MENPSKNIKMDDLGVSLFSETSMYMVYFTPTLAYNLTHIFQMGWNFTPTR